MLSIAPVLLITSQCFPAKAPDIPVYNPKAPTADLTIHPLSMASIADIAQDPIQLSVGEEALNDLYNRFTDHYGEFVTGVNSRQVNFDFIMGASSAKTTMELKRLYNTATGEGLNMDSFIDFGFIPAEKFQFEYEYNENPHLAGPTTLFHNFMTASRIGFNAERLIKAGLRQQDIDTLKSYIKTNPFENIRYKASYLLLTYFQQNAHFYKKTIADKATMPEHEYRTIMQRFSHINRYLSHNVERNWGLGLVSTLDNKRQGIFKAYLVNSLRNGAMGGKAMITPGSSSYYVERLAAEKSDEKIEQTINELEEKLNLTKTQQAPTDK